MTVNRKYCSDDLKIKVVVRMDRPQNLKYSGYVHAHAEHLYNAITDIIVKQGSDSFHYWWTWVDASGQISKCPGMSQWRQQRQCFFLLFEWNRSLREGDHWVVVTCNRSIGLALASQLPCFLSPFVYSRPAVVVCYVNSKHTCKCSHVIKLQPMQRRVSQILFFFLS